MALGVVGPLGGAPFLRSPGVWNVCVWIVVQGPLGSGSPRSVLFGDIGPVGGRHMVMGQRRFFGLVRVVFFQHDLVAAQLWP